jgi:hypothetical protein
MEFLASTLEPTIFQPLWECPQNAEVNIIFL